MNRILAMTSLLFLLSCNEAENEPVATKPPIRKDSNIIRKEPANPYVSKDLSAMDISYFPDDYPVLKMTRGISNPPVARVIYSRPHRQGRKIFGGLLKYGEPWRLGANEATEIEFFRAVTIQGKRVGPGRFNIYAVPQEKEWTIILNTNIYSWGLKQDSTKDVHKFRIPVQPTPQTIEDFTMVFQRTATGADLLIAWEDVVARLPITVK
jgi:Protein of unknown function (DUF2911)